MNKNVEVEIRGPLTQEQADILRASIAAHLTPKGKFDRYMIDFTTDEMKKQKLDVRSRITNGKVELIVKKGDFLTGARAEFPVQCKDDQFIPLSQALIAMGFVEGTGCHRVSDRFEDDQIELAIIEVPGHSIFYEAEMMADEHDAVAAEEKLRAWAAEHQLRVYTNEEFHGYVDRLDAEANDTLDLREQAAWELVAKRIEGQSS